MRWVRSVLVVALLVGLAACGEAKSSLETVRGAAAATTDANTFRFSTSVSGDSEMVPDSQAEGIFDVANRLASVTADAGQYGLPGMGEIDIVMTFADGFVIYMNMAALFEEAPEELAGKQWVSMDLGALAEMAGLELDFAQIMQSSSNDPTSSLNYLRGATDVTEVGSEEVRGVDTTHYRATIDLQKALDESPEAARDALQPLVDMYTDTTVQVEVWIDDDDRVRRYETTQDLSKIELPEGAEVPEGALEGTITIRQELHDFGVEADIEVPSDDEVIDFLDLISQLPAEEELVETPEPIN
jgi:hypothetical protein